jgi:hypothetical protein
VLSALAEFGDTGDAGSGSVLTFALTCDAARSTAWRSFSSYSRMSAGSVGISALSWC